MRSRIRLANSKLRTGSMASDDILVLTDDAVALPLLGQQRPGHHSGLEP